MNSEADASGENRLIDASDPAIVAPYQPYLQVLARVHLCRADQAS